MMQSAITESKWPHFGDMLQRSVDFMAAVRRKDCDEVAAILEKIHNSLSVPMHYNTEGDLTATLLFATYVAREECIVNRDAASSHGYADVVLIPTKPKTQYIPTIFELKLDESVDSAIRQVEKKKYFEIKDLQNYHGDVLAVAVRYDRKAKKHVCSMKTVVI